MFPRDRFRFALRPRGPAPILRHPGPARIPSGLLPDTERLSSSRRSAGRRSRAAGASPGR